MTPLSLRLKGFAGIKAGLGLDEVELDLRTLPNDAQLVALAGPNGIGKSTLLDNLHPYRQMPSRLRGDATGAFSFYDHICAPEAVKRLVWSYRGVVYRSELLLRAGGKRKTEAYLHVQEDGRWVPARMADGTVCDGRVETYDACVEQLLGSAVTFFTAHFAAQNRRTLSEYRAGEIKTLLSELLGLDDIRRMQERAAETARLLKAGLLARRAQQRAYDVDVEKLSAQRQALGDVDAAFAAAVTQRAAAQAAVEDARQRLSALQAERNACAAQEQRRSELLQAREETARMQERALQSLSAQRQRDLARIAQIDQAVAARRQAARRRIEEADARRRRLLEVLAGAGRIRRAVRRLPLREAVVAARRQQCATREREAQQARGDVDRLRRLREQVADIERAAGQASLRMEDLKRRLRLQADVPCNGSDLQQHCPLLHDARHAQSLMPSAQSELAALARQRAEVRQLIDALAGSAQTLHAAESALALARRKLDRSERSAKACAVMAARLGEAREAGEGLQALNEELRRLQADAVDGLSPEEAAERQSAVNHIEQLDADRAELLARFGEQIASIERELAALPAGFDPHALQAASAALGAAQKAFEVAEARYAEALRSRQQAQDLDAQLAQRQREACAAAGVVSCAEQDLSWWQLLAHGLGNDGVIALCIDDAGPELSALANALLLACYGPRFTVSIRTQSTTVKGELREDFDIVVHDGASGDSKPLRHLSGGEQVWIGEAMTRAIALYVAQRNGFAHETLFADETDGPLDPERKRMFMAMKREVLRLGGYRREYFVSQTPELTNMADAIIDVADLRCQARAAA